MYLLLNDIPYQDVCKCFTSYVEIVTGKIISEMVLRLAAIMNLVVVMMIMKMMMTIMMTVKMRRRRRKEDFY
jgi:hypothetical protein